MNVVTGFTLYPSFKQQRFTLNERRRFDQDVLERNTFLKTRNGAENAGLAVLTLGARKEIISKLHLGTIPGMIVLASEHISGVLDREHHILRLGAENASYSATDEA